MTSRMSESDPLESVYSRAALFYLSDISSIVQKCIILLSQTRSLGCQIGLRVRWMTLRMSESDLIKSSDFEIVAEGWFLHYTIS